MKRKQFYWRHMPHYQPPNATYHVVFRLDGSLPRRVIERLKRERVCAQKRIFIGSDPKQSREDWRLYSYAYFVKFDRLLDDSTAGPKWLAQPEIAGIVSEALRYRDGWQLDVLSYCIMPNHVHLVCSVIQPDPPDSASLTEVLANLKWYTGLKANCLLGRTGAFWQQESYDHVIRNGDELKRTIWYVLKNKVKAGLSGTIKQWLWNYCKPELLVS